MKKKEIEERICGIEESINDLKKCIHILSDRLSPADVGVEEEIIPIEEEPLLDDEDEDCYILSEAMIMSNAVNKEIKDISLLLGVSPFDMETYGKIVDEFMNGMVKAGYISKSNDAA